MMPIEVIHPNKEQIGQILGVQADVFDMTATPVMTTQTITSAKAMLPASPKSGRKMMFVTNTDELRTVRIGSSGISEKVGMLVEPKHTIKVIFDTSTPQDVYAIATGAEAKVEVIEA